MVSVIFLVLIAILAALAYLDFVFPYIVYPLQAKLHKAGSLPVVGSIPFGIPNTLRIFKEVRNDNLLRYFADLPESQGPIKTILQQLLFRWVIITRDPENIKTILSTKFEDFSFVERNRHLMPVIGSGIFTQDGKKWKHSREMLKPQFTKDQVSRLEHVSHHVDIMIDQIKKRGGRAELQHVFHLMTIDTATQFLFGESVDSLRFSGDNKGVHVIDPATGEHVYSTDFVESYTYLVQFALHRILLHDFEFIALLSHWNYKKHLRRCRIYLDHYAQLALKKTEGYIVGEDNVKGEYIFSNELAKETRDPVVIRDQVFNILIAGRDTTASTLSYAFHYFTNHPDVWEKVRKDVWAVFPNGDATYATYEDLRKPHYLQMVIKEVLRLAPAVPLNLRTAIRDTYLPHGGGAKGDKPVFVPKGTTVNYPTYVLHRDKMIYGPDAREFRPERWAPENRIPNSPMNTWGYIPFNGGPRICLGQQFALTEITLTIVKLALAFETVTPDVGFSARLQDRNSLTTMVGGAGVPVVLQ